MEGVVGMNDMMLKFDPYSDENMKRKIRDFLRYRMVDPCDLITGDHAADIAWECVREFTPWAEAVCRIRLENELAMIRDEEAKRVHGQFASLNFEEPK
jgi:hypothetical protein